MPADIIHITGASGAGTTTLAKTICDRFGHVHFDTDDFYWEPTDPPVTQKRAVDQCQRLLAEAIDSAEKCVISGSLTEWGDVFVPRFGLIIYVFAPAEIRLQRLQAREHRRFGKRILPGGDMFEAHQAFLQWANQYDSGSVDMRSAAHHRAWLKRAPCPVVRVDGIAPAEEMFRELDF